MCLPQKAEDSGCLSPHWLGAFDGLVTLSPFLGTCLRGLLSSLGLPLKTKIKKHLVCFLYGSQGIPIPTVLCIVYLACQMAPFQQFSFQSSQSTSHFPVVFILPSEASLSADMSAHIWHGHRGLPGLAILYPHSSHLGQ